jgi:hypothetical protein
VVADGPVLVEDAVVADNTGGAVRSTAPITIRDSTFLGNSANVSDGQVFADGGVTVTNSTFADGTGQAIRNEASGAITLDHVTLSGDVGSGGTLIGGFAGPLDATASVLVTPNDAGGVNCNATFVSGGHNWSDDQSCGFTGTGDTEDVGADPLLGPARDNGSPPTMFPLLGSPLVDAIPNGSCDPTLTADQRGVARPFPAGGACDIGAIEAVFAAHALTDVTKFYEATVRWVTSTVNTPQILQGYNDGTFGQSRPINRGQTARLYYRAAGAPDVSSLPAHGFTDVSAFFEDAVRWAKANGLFDGYTDNTFREKNPINRGNYTRSLYNFAGAPDVSGLPPHGFSDVTPFYDDAVTWAKANGLANGFGDNTYRQTNPITRGNASRIFYNTAQTKAAWDDTMTAPPNMLFKSNLPA